jgi:DmsE family decaheme c-type cytochrome
LLTGVVVLVACSPSLRKDKPVQPIRDYERMIVGRLDADYVGNDQCLAKCHAHDKKKTDFDNSVHGEQIDADSGLPLVNCESCHGPGSLAVAAFRIREDGQPMCQYDKLIDLDELPAQAQSLTCLKCHSANSSANLALWGSSTHATSEVSCFNCHKLHTGVQQKLDRHDMAETCYSCHPNIRSQFSQSSHHPVNEHKMDCSACHDPHGTMNNSLLREATIKATCTRCHMEYQGPFVYEHADVTEDCTNCHNPHGSPNNPLLNQGMPFLCLQCHAGHSAGTYSARGTLSTTSMKQVFFNRCTDCHAAIHGTDVPSPHGRGTFIR